MVPEQINQTVKIYSDFFANTDIGYDAAQMLIKNICDQALLNRSFLKKDIRISVQKFFEESQKALTTDASKALGMSEVKCWTSLPVNNTLFYGPIDQSECVDLTLGKSTYKKCAVRIGYDNIVPMIPVYETIDPITSQCLRLYIRACLVNWLKEKHGITLDFTAEELIYVFGALMLRVVVSDAPQSVKDAYRKCFKTMLQKKVTSTTFITQLQELLDGKVPSNGAIEPFQRKMELAVKMLGLDEEDWMYLWFAICTGSEIEGLAKAQYPLYQKFCTEDLTMSKIRTNLHIVNVTERAHSDKIYTEPISLVHNTQSKVAQPKVTQGKATISAPTTIKNYHSNRLNTSKNIIVCFRISVDKQVINTFVNYMQTCSEFPNHMITVANADTVGPANLNSFIENNNREPFIIILPNTEVKLGNLDSIKLPFRSYRVTSGTTCDGIINGLKAMLN